MVCVLSKGRRDKRVKLTCTVGYSCTCISVFNQSVAFDTHNKNALLYKCHTLYVSTVSIHTMTIGCQGYAIQLSCLYYKLRT